MLKKQACLTAMAIAFPSWTTRKWDEIHEKNNNNSFSDSNPWEKENKVRPMITPVYCLEAVWGFSK